MVVSARHLHAGKWQSPSLSHVDSNGNLVVVLWDVTVGAFMTHEWMTQPWLMECACWFFQLAKWSISNIQNILHEAKYSHRMGTYDLQTLLSGARIPRNTRARTASSCGLVRAACLKLSQRGNTEVTEQGNSSHSGLWEWGLTCQMQSCMQAKSWAVMMTLAAFDTCIRRILES
jgi:hypothetical protein